MRQPPLGGWKSAHRHTGHRHFPGTLCRSCGPRPRPRQVLRPAPRTPQDTGAPRGGPEGRAPTRRWLTCSGARARSAGTTAPGRRSTGGRGEPLQAPSRRSLRQRTRQGRGGSTSKPREARLSGARPRLSLKRDVNLGPPLLRTRWHRSCARSPAHEGFPPRPRPDTPPTPRWRARPQLGTRPRRPAGGHAPSPDTPPTPGAPLAGTPPARRTRPSPLCPCYPWSLGTGFRFNRSFPAPVPGREVNFRTTSSDVLGVPGPAPRVAAVKAAFSGPGCYLDGPPQAAWRVCPWPPCCGAC